MEKTDFISVQEMLVNKQLPPDGYRHNYVRLIFILGTLLLFVGYIYVSQVYEIGNSPFATNGTFRAEDTVVDEVTPSNWIYRSLNALNYMWQLAWLLYSCTFIYRRSSAGYLYLAPSTLSPIFYLIFIAAFLIPSIWLLFFQRIYVIWTWIPYAVSFSLLSLALFTINNNLASHKKIYETEGFNRDIWCLRFFAQNGVAFFACWTAVRFILAFDTFLQLKFGISMQNSGTIVLAMAAVIAAMFFFLPNFNAALVDSCAYQFAPWIVFIIYFWGVVENNWIPNNAQRNNVIAAGELAASVISAVGALSLFTMRYRTSKIDPIA